jgi:tellurite resistance protein TerC
MVKRLLVKSVRTARRVVVAVVGGTVILLGVALLVLPGPAMLVIPLGLAVLGLEFA